MIYINLIVFFSILSSSLCMRSYTIQFVSYTHEYRNDFFQSCTFKLLNNSQRLVFNGSLSLSRDLDKVDITIKVIVKENNKRRPWKLLDITIDGCELIGGKNKRSLSLVNNVVKNVKSFGHLIPDYCPVKKGIEYYLKNFQWDEDLYPPGLPILWLNVFVGLLHKTERFYKASFGVVIEKNVTLHNGIQR